MLDEYGWIHTSDLSDSEKRKKNKTRKNKFSTIFNKSIEFKYVLSVHK